MNLPLFLSRKIYYAQGDQRKQVSRPAIRIATIGVAIGVAVMIITVSVIMGFKHTVRDKVAGFGSHIQVQNILSASNADPLPICINDSMLHALKSIEGVRHAERFANTQGILKTDNDFLGIVFKGIAEEYDTTFLKSCLLEGQIPLFSDSASHYQLLISKTMADKLQLKCKDRVFAYFINEDNVRTRRFTIAGIYETNMKRFDDNMAITDLSTVNKLNGWFPEQCSGAELLIDDFNELNPVYERVISKVNRTLDRYNNIFGSISIVELYPQVFSWLELLDINVWIILALMVAVAGFTMVSGLLIIILERTQMIGLLKAIGARNSTIRHTFLWFSVFIIGKGLVIGNIVGIGLVLLQQYTGLVKLDPQTYYVSEAPMELNLLVVLLLNVATLIICVFVLIAPSYLVSHIHPAKSMRYE